MKSAIMSPSELGRAQGACKEIGGAVILGAVKILLTVGLIGLLGLQALGLDALLATQECERSCPTDGPDGSCAPFCLDCVCCPTMRSFVQPEPAGPPPALATRATPLDSRISNPSPRAADIFHVPRPSLT